MAAYTESTPSITSKRSKLSVYQTEGKPLSSEALYRAKMKYGIYNNPAKVSLGVDPSASDTAALLAANSDLTVEKYSRELSADAATAALYAKSEPPAAWSRNSIAPEAEYAAISAKSPINFSRNTDTDLSKSGDAASAALKTSAKSTLQEQYDFDDVRSGKITLSKYNTSNSKSLKSLSGNKDHRSGISTSNRANEGSRNFNISGISDAAKKSAAKTMTSRLTPELGPKSGLKTSGAKEANTKSSSIYIKDIYSQSQDASKRALEKYATPVSYGLQTPSDDGLFVNPAAFAADALKEDVKVDFAASQRATLKNNTLVSQNVYAYATRNAEAAIAKLNDKAATDSIFSNKKFNEKAYEIAYANAQKRKAASSAGSVQLGGGLNMSASEIHKLAESLVAPALSDMDDKITKMKAFDVERSKLPDQIKKRDEEFKAEQRAKEVALQKKREAEAAERRVILKNDKSGLIDAYVLLSNKFDDEYAAKETEVNANIAEYDANKAAIDEERAAKKKVLDDTKAEKDADRDAEFDLYKQEHEDDIAPLLAEFEKEDTKLKELVEVREEKEAYATEQKNRVDKAQAELDALLDKLKVLETRATDLDSDLKEVDGQLAEESTVLVASQGRLKEAGHQKESEIPDLEEKIGSLKTEREGLHSTVDSKRAEIEELAAENHTESKAINEIYPEHLREEVEEPLKLDDNDLDDGKFELDNKSIEIPPEVESEPEAEPESVWPAGYNADGSKVKEEKEEEGTEKAVATSGTKQVVHSMIPDDLPEAKPLGKAPAVAAEKKKKTAAPANTAKTSTKADKGKGIFGIFSRKNKTTKATAPVPAVAAAKPKVDTTETVKKYKGLQTEAEASVKDAEAAPEKPKVAETTKDNKEVDNDVFSGFSQGS